MIIILLRKYIADVKISKKIKRAFGTYILYIQRYLNKITKNYFLEYKIL